jgi:hypothetical protein
MSSFNVLTIGNPKTLKGEVKGFLTFILHLAPADLSGYQVCPKATAGCKAACLNTAGRGGMFKKGETTNVIQKARIRKTKLFFEDRTTFMALLVDEIARACMYAEKRNLTPVIRLNGTSDIAWEKIRCERPVIGGMREFRNLMEAFPFVQFYDYTKIPGRTVPPNYHLTFSRAESNQMDVKNVIGKIPVAVVFSTKILPESYLGYRVISGDESDLRFNDPSDVVIGLFAKGRAKKDNSGFVVKVQHEQAD